MICPRGVFLTGIVIHQVLQALEGEPWGDVIPVVRQAEDSVMLHLPVSHGEGIKPCGRRRAGQRHPAWPPEGGPLKSPPSTAMERLPQPWECSKSTQTCPPAVGGSVARTLSSGTAVTLQRPQPRAPLAAAPR